MNVNIYVFFRLTTPNFGGRLCYLPKLSMSMINGNVCCTISELGVVNIIWWLILSDFPLLFAKLAVGKRLRRRIVCNRALLGDETLNSLAK